MDRTRDEIAAHVKTLAIGAVNAMENATSLAESNAAAFDMRRYKSWLDWLERAELGRGSRFS